MSDVTTGSVFNPQFFMSPPWWLGRVEEKETWSDNIEGETFTSVAGIEGWGHRYKVRVFNWHTGELDKLPPKDMAFCQVVMPVTAGSGHGGAAQTPSIESGSVVFGFFMDGMAGQEGYIMGVLGNSNNNVPKERGKPAPNQKNNSPSGSSSPPVPALGAGSLANVPVPPSVDQLSTQQLNKLLDPSRTPSSEEFKAVSEAKRKAKSAGLPASEVTRLGQVAAVKASRKSNSSAKSSGNCNKGYQQFNDTYTDGDEMTSAKVPDDRIVAGQVLSVPEAQHIETVAKQEQYNDSNVKIPLEDVCKEGNSEIKGIQRVIQNLLNDIEFLKKKFNQVSAFVSDVSEFANQVQAKVLGAIEELSRYLKTILTSVRGYVLTTLADQIKKIAPFLFPSEGPKLDTVVEKGLDLINCLFNRLIDGLKSLLAGLLSDVLDQFVNAPLCAVENFLGNFLDSILGPIVSVVDSIFGSIGSLFGSVLSGISQITGALDFISGILQFFSCDQLKDCVPYNEISQSGLALPGIDIPELNLPEAGASAPECPTGPQLCGPPSLRLFGGGGSGAIVNPIISSISSSVIGFDIVNPGSGYLTPPSAALVDPCGNGSGAQLQVNLEDEDGGAGTGAGAGAGGAGTGAGGAGGAGTGAGGAGTGAGAGTGGGKDPCQIPKDSFKNKIDSKLNKRKKIKSITIISPGDGYLSSFNGSLGGGGKVWKESDEGYVKTKCGGYFVVQPYKPIKAGKGDTYCPPNGPCRILEEDEIINLPLEPVNPPQSDNLTYPVILCIEEIKVLNKGFGYRPGDKLIITPNNGTIANLVINENGEIVEVKLLNGGCGYNDLPSLKTDSSTGFNATFSVIFKPTKLSDFDGEVTGVINVVDCIGKKK